MQNSDCNLTAEERIVPERARATGLTRSFVYHGSSMLPGFRPGHLLYVRPTARALNVGDVIVFPKAEGAGFVVHRVVAVKGEGLVTRGDNNSQNDGALVAWEQVVGRVEMAEENGRMRPVAGGRQGHVLARIYRNMGRLGRSFRRTFGGPYRWLRGSGLVARWWHPHLTAVQLTTPNGTLVKYILGGRTVARWRPETGDWWCEQPYDLVIHKPHS